MLIAIPEADVFLEKKSHYVLYADGMIDVNGDEEEESGCETESHDKEQSLRNFIRRV